jgi:MFS family permease
MTLALGRILLGIGLAGILMGGLKALSEWFPQARFASVAGLLTGIGALGGLLSTSPMAWLNEQVGWRAVFIGGALLTALSLTYILVGTRNRPPDAPPLSPQHAENHLRAIFGSVSFWRIAAPVVWIGGVGTAFRGLWGGPYLNDIYGLSDIATGNLLLLMGIGSIASAILLGWLTDRYGAVRIVVICSLILITCQLILAGQPSLWLISAVYLVMGLAGGFAVALLAQARHIFPSHMCGQAFAMLNMTAFAGAFLLQWWIGEIVAYFPAAVVGHSLPQAYTGVFIISAVGSVIALMCYLPLLRSQQQQQNIA